MYFSSYRCAWPVFPGNLRLRHRAERLAEQAWRQDRLRHDHPHLCLCRVRQLCPAAISAKIAGHEADANAADSAHRPRQLSQTKVRFTLNA